MLTRRPGRLTTPSRLAAAFAAALLAFALYSSTFVVSYGELLRADDPLLAADVAGIAPARVARVDDVEEVELIIFHDLSIDRLTSGTGRVRDKTLKEMLALDLGPEHDPAIRGAPVRTFEDFVRTVKGRGTLMVELKVPGLGATGIEQRAVDIVRKHDAHHDAVLSSFNPLVLYRLKRLDPNLRTALIFMDTNWNPELVAEIKEGDLVDYPWPLRQEFIRRAVRKLIRPDLLSINHEVNETVIDRLIAKGWPAFIWTADEEADLRRALSKRPYGVISDQPIRARGLRDE